MKIAKETWVLLGIGLIDLVTTIVFIRNHSADEANPLFRPYWKMGIAAFVAAKIALLAGPLIVLEWARARNPKFVLWALRSTIAAYLIMYGAGFFKLNGRAAEADEIARVHSPAEQKAITEANARLPLFLEDARRKLASGHHGFRLANYIESQRNQSHEKHVPAF